MNLFGLSGLLISITSLSMALLVYLKARKSAPNRLWAIFAVSVAIWGFGGYKLSTITDEAAALLWWRLTYIGIILLPAFFTHFVYVFLGIKRKKIILAIYLFTLVFMVANFTSKNLFIGNLKFIFSSFYWLVPPGPVCIFFILFSFFGLVIYSHYELFKAMKKASGLRRNQMKYFFLATAVGFSGGATCFLPCFGIIVYPYGNFTVPLYPMIMAYAIIKYSLMDINVVITRGLAYGGITAVIAGAYIGLMAGVDRIFGGVVGYNPVFSHSLLFIVVLFALIYVLPQMKIRAIEITRKTLFRGKYDYQQELGEATRIIPTMLNLKQLGDYILTKIRDTMMVNKLTLFVYDEAKHFYFVSASHGLDKNVVSKIKIGENSALAGLLRDAGKPLVKEELERTGTIPEEAMGLAIEHLNSLGAELCIPLILKDDLTGILTLSNKRTGEMFTEEDLSLLSALANQVALTIEYIKAIDKISTEKRYVGLGKASMRMAHDIKNPLVPLKTFLQVLPDKYPKEFAKMSKIDAEFTGRFYESALEGVDRINLLIERALHYARHPQPIFSEIDLDNTLDDVLAQEDVELKKAKIQLQKQYSPSDNSLKADSEQLIELFSNLISNSIDAMGETTTKKLTVKTKSLNGRVMVEIIDTGCGIPKNKIDTIFDPFITYKHQGSGLGLAIVKKIVDDHKGTIEVNSEAGKGTTFKIILPKKQ